jgi:citrate synthase
VCERSTGASISQALHLMNSPNLQNKLTHAGGRITRLASMTDAQVIEELWLACFSRFPDEKERQDAMEHISTRHDRRRQSIEDLAWSLMNTTEFVFNH